MSVYTFEKLRLFVYVKSHTCKILFILPVERLSYEQNKQK